MALFGGGTQTTNSTTTPWKPAQPYLLKGMAQAGKLYNQGAGFKAPGFQTWVPFSSQTQGALSGMQAIAGQGNPLAGQSEAAISGILSGDTNAKYSDLFANSDNAHFAAATDTQASRLADDIARQFSGSGRYGSDAMGGAMARQIGDFREKALSDNWNQNIANQRGILGDQSQEQLAAVAAAPGAYQQRYLPSEQLAKVGSAYDDLASRQLQSRLDRFNTNQQSGWNRLGAYNGALSGSGGQGSSKTESVKSPSNWLGAILGGALGGGSLGNSILGGAAGYGIPGAIGGGILGLLSGL